MLHTCIDGLVMGNNVRRNVLLGYFAATVSLTFFSSFLCYEAFVCSKDSRLAAIITAILLSILTLYISFVSGIKTIRMVSVRYSCNQQCISVQYAKQFFRLDLLGSYFLTKIQIRFYRGKGSEIIPFYLFSAKPIGYLDEELVGLKGFMGLLYDECVIIPCDHCTDLWLNEILCIRSVPEYPKAIYKPNI